MPIFSDEEQAERTKAIMHVLNNWNLSAKDQLNLLGLPASIKARHIQHYQQEKTLPQSEEINERIDHLLGIEDALRTSFPHNQLMGALWLTTQHRRFENKAPLEIMLMQGLAGLISVRSHLDCAFDWQQDDKNQS